MTARTTMRPRSVAAIAERTVAGSRPFDVSVREFLDTWQNLNEAEKTEALSAEPRAIKPLFDAYLAALAEHLALSDSIATPAWTEKPGRFLSEPFFSGALESLKATLLVESPLAFRRRQIFISADGLSRPNRRVA